MLKREGNPHLLPMSTDFNQLLESISQNISEAVFRTDKNGMIYVNKAFVRMFGFSSEQEAMDAAIISMYQDPRDRRRLVNKLKEEKIFENEEVVFLRKDNTEFVGLLSAMVHQNEKGEVFWDGAIRDVTKEREYIDKIRSREQLLESINRNINEGIYRTESEKGIIYANDAFIKMFGYDSLEEIVALDPMMLYKEPKNRKVVGEEIIEKGAIDNRNIEFRRKDGTTFWGNLNTRKLKGSYGKIYFDGAIRDITPEKEYERSLVRYAEMQRILIGLSTKYINLPLEEVEHAIDDSLRELCEFVGADRAYVFDIDKEKNTCNNTYEWCAKGIAPEIKNSQNIPLSIMPELVNTHEKGNPMIVENSLEVKKEGFRELLKAQKIKSLMTVPMMHHQECVGFVGFDWVNSYHAKKDKEVILLELFSEMLVNIRNRSHNELKLHKLFDKTKEQNQRLKDFSYITSHNFRASVANLVGLVSVMEEYPDNKEYFEMFKKTVLKLNRSIDMINDLLNFEKDIDSLEKEEVNLSEIVYDVILLNTKTIAKEKVTFDVDISEGLRMQIIPAYLQSILHNLINNAMKYGVTESCREIKICAKKQLKEVVLTVSDQGKGIDLDKYRKKMFQLGSRFHANETSGHGMGLYMTKQQVEAMGGRIEVESELNKGTRFKVYFHA